MASAIRVIDTPPRYPAVASTGQFGERVSAFLAADLPERREFSARHRGLIDAFASSSVVILALWRPDHGLCESADELSFQHRVPWLPVIMEHPVIRIGPMVRPPAGPCFRCYANRRVQHDRDRWAAAILDAAYSNDHACGPKGYLPHHARLAAALARARLDRPVPANAGQVADAVTTIRLLAGDLRTWPVVACDGCDRCEPSAPPGRPDWLSELSARVRADGVRNATDGSNTGGRYQRLAFR
jgi:bacteriocin biosynthesis cyclodehydratase domain-containing protein